MLVVDTPIGCARASSIAVVNNDQSRFVELGWYEENQNVTPCPDTNGDPRVLRAKGFDGEFVCDPTTVYLSGSTWHDFKVQDGNQDGIWLYFRNGNQIGTYNLWPFVTGDPRANSERKRDHDDSAWADFEGLQRMVNSVDYVHWDGTTGIKDSDPDYRNCIRSDLHVEVDVQC